MSGTRRILAATVVAAGWLALSGARGDMITHSGTTVNMAFVDIGSAGNAADNTGYGSVGYDYRMGTYEVSADQWAAVLAVDSGVGDAGVGSGSQPTAATSWYEAAKFCNWLTTGNTASGVYDTSASGWGSPNAGAFTAIMDHQAAAALYGTAYFIPTQNEWYKAAYYSATGVYYDYPTGSDSVPDGIDSFGDSTFDAVFADPFMQDQPNAVTSAGDLSPFLTMGQGGNVWEWNETRIGLDRGRRGATFNYDSSFLLATFRDSDSPENEAYDGGFRVASISIGVVPEPGSLGLLLLGLAGLATRRKRVSR